MDIDLKPFSGEGMGKWIPMRPGAELSEDREGSQPPYA